MLWDKDSYQADGYTIWNVSTCRRYYNIHGEPYEVYTFRDKDKERALNRFNDALLGLCDIKSMLKPEGHPTSQRNVYIDWRTSFEVMEEDGEFVAMGYLVVMSEWEYLDGFSKAAWCRDMFKKNKSKVLIWQNIDDSSPNLNEIKQLQDEIDKFGATSKKGYTIPQLDTVGMSLQKPIAFGLKDV